MYILISMLGRELTVQWYPSSRWLISKHPDYGLMGTYYEGADREASGWSVRLWRFSIRFWNWTKVRFTGPHN